MANAQLFDSTHQTDPIGFWHGGRFDAQKVVDFIDFSKGDIADLAHVKLSSVRYDARIPKAVQEHIEQIANICSIVAELLDKDLNKTALWLDTPNPLLGNISPKLMIRYGRYEKLLGFILEAKSNRPDDKEDSTVVH